MYYILRGQKSNHPFPFLMEIECLSPKIIKIRNTLRKSKQKVTQSQREEEETEKEKAQKMEQNLQRW